jgi:hypothetical protein
VPSEPLQLAVSVGVPDTDSAEARDEEARLLRRELEDAGLAEAAVASAGSAPPGTKSPEALAVGALTLSVLPGALAAVLALAHDWIARRPDRALTFSYGEGAQRIEFQYDPARTDVNQVVAQLLQAHAAAANSLAIGAGSQVGGDAVGGDKVTHTTVDGDSVGRDKVTHVHAAPGATVIIGSREAGQGQASPPAEPAEPAGA